MTEDRFKGNWHLALGAIFGATTARFKIDDIEGGVRRVVVA